MQLPLPLQIDRNVGGIFYQDLSDTSGHQNGHQTS
jgi:hypothetical protein